MQQGILNDGAAAAGLADDQAAGDGVFDAFAGHAAAGELGLGGEAPELGVDVLGDAGGDVDGLAPGAVVTGFLCAFHGDKIPRPQESSSFLQVFLVKKSQEWD